MNSHALPLFVVKHPAEKSREVYPIGRLAACLPAGNPWAVRPGAGHDSRESGPRLSERTDK
jgi:hypothetical protein